MSIQLFQYKQNSVRVAKVDETGAPWFVAKDVCNVLGLSTFRTSLALLDDDEKGVHSVDSLGGPQEMGIISEAGLYALLLRSRKPEAKEFKRWVTHEVLPQIRKTGRYDITKPATELDAIEANARAVVQMVGEIRESRRIAVEALQKADENSSKIAELSREQQTLIERQQTALASVPVLPEPTEPTASRTTRSNVVELLRATSIRTGVHYRDVTAKAYHELKYRHGVDILQRLRNIKKQQGQGKTTGLDIVAQLGHMDRFYALCVELFGLPSNPFPPVELPPGA